MGVLDGEGLVWAKVEAAGVPEGDGWKVIDKVEVGVVDSVAEEEPCLTLWKTESELCDGLDAVDVPSKEVGKVFTESENALADTLHAAKRKKARADKKVLMIPITTVCEPLEKETSYISRRRVVE